MGSQSLKSLIKGANKKVSENKDALLEQATQAGRAGTTDELVELLKSNRDVFDEQFDSQLPSLEKHLATRDPDNLKMMTEVISGRLTSLGSLSAQIEDTTPDNSSENPPGDETNEANSEGDAEEDFASLLQQKSVDEMSEEERQQINIGEKTSTEDLESLFEEHSTGADEIPIPEPPAPAVVEAQPPPADNPESEEEVDFSSILEQKSVDEMDEHEIESIALSEESIDPKEEPQQDSGADLDDEGSEPVETQADDHSSATSEPGSDEKRDELDDLLDQSLPEPQHESSSEGTEESENSIEKNNHNRELETQSTSEEGEIVQNTEAAQPEESDELDQLMNEAPLAEEQSDSASADDQLEDILAQPAADAEQDDTAEDASSADPLDNLIEDVKANQSDQTEDTSPENDPLEELSQNKLSAGDQEELNTDTLDDLLEDTSVSGEGTSVEEGTRDLMAELIEEDPDENESEGKLASDTDILEEVEGDDDAADTDVIASTEDIEQLSEEETNTPTNTEVEKVLAEVEEEKMDNSSVTQMLDTLKEDESEDDKTSDSEPEEELHDLLSDVTGRKMTEEDLESSGEEVTVSLTDLVENAETEFGDTQQERVLSESYRIERGSEMIYEGESEDELRKLIADHVLSGSSADIKVIKVTRKEIVKVVEEELPISVSIHS